MNKSKKLKFPRLSQELDRRKKLMDEDIKEIRILKEKGLSMVEIAKMYNVSYSSIYFWTNKKFREKVRKDAAQYRRGPEAIIRHRKISKKSMEYKLKVNPALKEYRDEHNKKYRELKKIK